MSEQNQFRRGDAPVIPQVECPHCREGMRLTIIEPAAMSDAGVETLVFECVCGFATRRPSKDA